MKKPRPPVVKRIAGGKTLIVKNRRKGNDRRQERQYSLPSSKGKGPWQYLAIKEFKIRGGRTVPVHHSGPERRGKDRRKKK